MADTSYYANRKKEHEKKLQAALKDREQRKSSSDKSAPSQTSQNSYYGEKKKQMDSRIQTALNARRTRVQSSLPDVLSDIKSRFDSEVDSYNKTSKPAFGSFDQTYASQRERRLALNELKKKVLAYSQYMDDGVADNLVSILDQMNSGYDSYLNLSKFETEDDYNTAVRQWGYSQKYQGKNYDELNTILADMDDGEEKEWLRQYAPTVMNQGDYEKYLSEANTKIDAETERLNQLYAKRNFLQQKITGYSRSGGMGEQVKSLREELNQVNAAIEEAEGSLEGLKADKWEMSNEQKYRFLSDEADFAQNSKYVSTESQSKWDKMWSQYDLGYDDLEYEFINNQGDIREQINQKARTYGADNHKTTSTYQEKHYDLMNEQEVATYNYLYSTQGKDAAKEYLEHLEYTLNERAMGEYAQNAAAFADEHPFISSAVSVPANLMSGIGIFDIAAQNAKRAITGEYRPIDYNTDAMLPSVASSTIRGTVAQNIADATGVIDINPDKNPMWAKIFNGKSLGDVYQLGMSMADSAAVAGLTAMGIPGGTFLLAGSAASQGVLDAVSKGATDDQALFMGLLNGVAEWFFEKYEIESILENASDGFIKSTLKSMLSEAVGEGSTTIANTISDAFVMAENSEWQTNIDKYMSQGMTESEATKQAFLDALIQVGWDAVGGAAMGGIMGGAASVTHNLLNKADMLPGVNAENKALYGQSAPELVAEAMEINPDNTYAQRMQGRLDNGKELTGRQITKLLDQNEAGMRSNDMASIESAAANRLTELGETGDVATISKALAKQAAGEKLSKAENQAIADSKYGQRVANELNPENIQSGDYASQWAEGLDTNRINVEEYSRLIEQAQTEQTAQDAQTAQEDVKTAPQQDATGQQKPAQAEQVETVEDSGTTTQESNTDISPFDGIDDDNPFGKWGEKPAVTEEAAETGKKSLQVESTQEESTVSLEDASKKYGAQAGAMVHTYQAGQDVAQYDVAYERAYDMGKSGVSFSYVEKSTTVSYLTDKQKELAYEAGQAAANTEASEKAAANAKLANGKTGRKKGVVKGENVTIDDLKKTFNDTQGRAYKLLSVYAEATGIDIVLYRSEADADGKFQGAQGRYARSEPGTIYIDLNAGLSDIKSVDDLAKYTILRTFSHEFTHFIENWNPVQYNEFRKVVFDTLTQRGENVEFLIEQKQKGGLSYDKASREVVAEAMTDILPDANFVETLANEHKTIFQKLLDKLKEFLSDLKEYFSTIGSNRSREANALKEQVGDAVHYVENIVKMFDQVAVQAVENYQKTVATDEVIAESATTTTEDVQAETKTEVEEEVKPEPEVKTSEPYVSENGYTITDNAEFGSIEISFDGKPSETVRNALKENKFRWHKQKQVWYGKTSRETIIKALDNAYASHKEALDKAGESLRKSNEDMKAWRESITPKESAEETAQEVTAPEQDDAYTSLSEKLSKFNRVDTDRFVFRLFNKDGKWHGKVDAAEMDVGSGIMVSNARGVHYTSEVFDTRQEAMDDILAMVRNNNLLDERPAAEDKEVANNGQESENGTDTGTVQQPVLGGEAASQVLDGVQAEPVQPSSEGRQPVRSGEQEGPEDAGRDGRTDNRPVEADGAGSTGDRVGGRVQERRELTSDQQESKTQRQEQLHEEVQQEIQRKSTTEPNGSNFVIGDSLNLPNGTRARTRANIEAIKIVKQLVSEGRYATADEQTVLSKYVGWGGLADAFGKPVNDYKSRKITYEPVKGLEAEFEELKGILTEEEYKAARESTKNAHYTSIEVIKAMYDGLKHLGFTGGRMLEPSSGVGNFVGAMPADMTSTVKSWTMVELDNITGLISKYLYPNSDVRIQGFEETNIPDGYMDVAIGNVPFGNYAIHDKHYPKVVTEAIHNYFFAKALDKVRTGGIVMFITSSYTMNGSNSAVRKYIMQRADLLGAIRLPNTAFSGNAGTSVVTDILVLKKRADRTEYSGEAFEASNWERIGDAGYGGAYINEYFVNHPEMVLGIPKLTRGMYSGNELTYDPFTDHGSLGDQIRTSMQTIKGRMDYAQHVSSEKANFNQQKAKKKARNLQVKDGKIQAADENGNLVEVNVDQDTANRISGMVAIRDAYTSLADGLQQGVNQKSVNQLRKTLNKAYDEFVAKYGILNSPKNKKAINQFADRYSILSLENYNPETRKAVKTDIFTKNTISANRTATNAENVEEGLTISMNTVGHVDVSLIARLTGQKPDSVTRQLIDQRLAFKDKDGVLIPAVQYLSGNVRAKLREMEGLVGIDSDYQNNVEALRAVVPPTVPYTDIHVNPGANWVPTSVYEDFVGYILKRTNHTSYRTGIKDFSVEYVPETNEYKVSINDGYAKMSAQNTQVWGESGKAFSAIFENMLNGRRTNVYMEGPDGKRVLDRVKTEAVAEKVEKLNDEFRSWLWSDETRQKEMQELYNESYNSLVTPKYSGSGLTVNGMNSEYSLRPHQADAVSRIINSGGNTLLAHRVGAGKTMEMAAAAMKMKQLGIIKKPMFVVPNNVVAQWGKEFKDYFPAANILVVGDNDMTAAERMTTINRIKNNDYDAVILAYTKFEKIQMTSAWRQKFYEEQIDRIMFAINAEKEASKGKGFTVKQLENKRKQLENKVKKLTDKAKDEDGAMFEDLGVDALFVDEAHNFKNLEYTTRMNNVSGLGKADGSQRAFDLYTKVRYLQQLNGGRGIVFATATPVMNSMTEMYIMQRYLQPDTLNQLGIDNFDSWAKMFGEVVNTLEIAPSGSGYRLKQTFSKFKNVKALQQLFRSFTDVLTDIPGLKIPKMKGGKVQIVECEQGEFQENYMAELAKRAENVKSVDPSVDNMLKITSDGRKISYSQRMIDPSLPYEEGGKIYKCCDNVYKVYKESNKIKGTQMIFCDIATPKGKSNKNTDTDIDADEFGSVDMESAQLYDDMKARLIQLGIPAKEIAFIHDAKNDKQKEALSKKMNDGTIRVLIGSTGKMGVGLNAQVKAVAIHHLDAPWRPGDIEQRDGRVFRQKNENEEAYKFVYVTKGSFDSRLWDILERKQKFINQIMNGEDVGNEVEDTGEVTLSAAEVKAVASGSPLIMEQVSLEKEITKLESLLQAHNSGVSRAKGMIVSDERHIADLRNRISNVQEDIKSRKDTYSDDKKFSIKIGNQTFTDKKDAGVALMAAAEAKAQEGNYTVIGSFAGFTLQVVKTREGITGVIAGANNYDFKTYPLNTTYGINALISTVESLDGKLQRWQTALQETESDLATQKTLAAATFEQADKLKQKRTRYREVMDILNPPQEQAVSDDMVQEQSRAYLDEYPTDGVHWGIEAGIISNKEARTVWEAVANFDKRGYYYPKAINNGHYVESDNYLMIVGGNYNNPVVRTIFEFNDLYETTMAYAKELLINAEGIESEIRKACQIIEAAYGSGYVSRHDIGDYQAYGGENRGGKGRDGYGTDEEVQYQERTDTLTDRDVLEIAARDVNVSTLDAAERDALKIFQDRLSKLYDLQEKRAEQGRLYKEQQFGANVDRAAASETLNRMRVLDGQIQKASEDVLDVEKKAVLKKVLQKARKVVEAKEREHGQEILKRWRDRRNNAAAIKKYRERIRGDVDELTNWVLHPDNKSQVKHIPDALKNTVLPFLSSINFMSKQQLNGGNATAGDKAFMEQISKLEDVMKKTIDVDEMYSTYNDLPPDFMENLHSFIKTAQSIVNNDSGEFVINQMTAEELQQLSKVVRTLKKYIMQMNRFHVNAMFQHVNDAGDNSIDFMSTLKPAQNTGGVNQFLMWQQMRPAYAFERFGDGGMAIWDEFRQGQATLAFDTQKIQAFAEKAYTDNEVKAWDNAVKTIRLGPDSVVKMKVSQIMSLYELNKREQARGHILGDGIRVATFKDKKGQKISDVGHTLTPGELNLILRELTPRQIEVADKLQRFMQEQGGEWGNYVSVARFGEKQFGEENYFPINSDGRHLQVDADEKPGAASLYALLNMGFTKQTQEKAKNRIVVYSIFDVFSNHMASMAQYHAFALPVVDALKWFNYQQVSINEDGSKTILGSVREQMDRAFGVPEENRPGSGRRGYAQNFVINIIKAFNGTEAQGSPMDSFGLKTLHTYNRAQVAYNFRVVVQQPLAITRAAMLIDYSSIIRGMKLSPAAIQKNIQEMQKYSGIAAWKSLGFYDVNISRGLSSIIKHDETVMDKITEVGMWGAEKADLITWAAMWSACKEEVIRKQKLTPKSDGFYDAVTKLFEDVIYKTQVVDSVLTKNEFMRDKGFFARAVGSFMSEATTTASMLVDAYDKYHMDMQRGTTRQQAWKKNGRMIVRTVYVYSLGALILAAVQAVADAFRDDDDYQEFWEKWLEAFGGNLVDEMMPFNKLPIVSDFYDLAKELGSTWFGWDSYGNPPQSVFMQWYDSLVKGSEIIHDKITGEDTNYTWYGGAYKLLQVVSGMTGLPMAAATREIVTVWNNTVGAMAPSLKVKTYDSGEKNNIRYAYQDGYLTEEEATQELLDKGLVDTEDEAYWTIQGWDDPDGSYSRYDAIYEAVRNGGDFDAAMDELTSHGYTEKDVLSKVKSQIGAWYTGGEITKQQATNMLTKYMDMDSEDITATVNEWSCEVVTGIKYDDIKTEFLAGNITASRAKQMYMLYGGMSEEKAAEKVTVLEFVKDNPDMEDISAAAVIDYNQYCKSAGVKPQVFYDAWKYKNSLSGTVKEPMMDYINSLDLTYRQKDSLYYAFGWKESKIYEAPWH